LAFNEYPTNKQLALLRVGRHFDIDGHIVVVGRDEADNQRIEILKEPDDTILRPVNVEGPRTLIKGNDVNNEVLEKTASLTARYSQGRDMEEIKIEYSNSKEIREIVGRPKGGYDLVESLVKNN